MQRAARLIKNKKVSADLMTDEDIVRAAWPLAVGSIIASHTSRIRLVRTTLVVEVEDGTWQRQLHALSSQILLALKKATGGCPVESLEFRIGVARRQVQRAEARQTAPSLFADQPGLQDEAEGIRDPVLKKVYRLSRKRATA